MTTVDVLMITYNRPEYTQLSLPRLLEEADARTRIWIWHNGDDQNTIDVVRSYEHHPRLHALHLSPENVRLRQPTNWFWQHADSELIGKVDDDCLVPDGWLNALREIHACNRSLGVVSAWPFRPEDHDAELARRKTITLPGGLQLMQNPWTGGSGYLMKRACVQDNGILQTDDTFSKWCIRLALRGWLNGWHYPLLLMDHMDDPRSPNTCLRDDADFARRTPLNAINRDVPSLAETLRRAAIHARYLQTCPADARWYVGTRNLLRKTVNAARRCIGGRAVWTG